MVASQPSQIAPQMAQKYECESASTLAAGSAMHRCNKEAALFLIRSIACCLYTRPNSYVPSECLIDVISLHSPLSSTPTHFLLARQKSDDPDMVTWTKRTCMTKHSFRLSCWECVFVQNLSTIKGKASWNGADKYLLHVMFQAWQKSHHATVLGLVVMFTYNCSCAHGLTSVHET
jgi:hypothetical protein